MQKIQVNSFYVNHIKKCEIVLPCQQRTYIALLLSLELFAESHSAPPQHLSFLLEWTVVSPQHSESRTHYITVLSVLLISFYLLFFPNLATVVVWDSQVKDGYRHSKAPVADGGALGDNTSIHAAPLAWDGKKTSGVVEELLRNATDKAYGANSEILTVVYIRFFVFLFIF